MDLKIIGQGMTYKDPSVDQLCHLLLSSRKILCYKMGDKIADQCNNHNNANHVND
jgi:hypothetical protein